MPVQTFSLESLNTPTGRMLIVTDDEHLLRAVDWEDHEQRMQRLLRRHYGANMIQLREVSRPRRSGARFRPISMATWTLSPACRARPTVRFSNA